jgi:hypothetical protein
MVLFGLGTGLARAALAGLRAMPPGGVTPWVRTNYRGATVSLLAGPAVAAAAAITAAAGARPGLRWAAATVTAGSGLIGAYDDLFADRLGAASGTVSTVSTAPEGSTQPPLDKADKADKPDKGLHGHLAAVRQRRLSTGAVKAAGIGLLAIVGAGAVTRTPLDRLVCAGVIAGTANLLNLLDLRPGRALKSGLLVGAPLLRGPAGAMVAGPLGAMCALLPDDLGERVMIGDTGANPLGAVLGLRLAAGGGPRWRAGVFGVVLALNLASEKISFTRVIAGTPVLRELDRLGRRPS